MIQMCVSYQCVRQQFLKTFCETTGPMGRNFHMEHELTIGFQNYSTGLGRESKLTVNFFS